MRLLRLSVLNFLVMGSTFLFFSTSIRIAEPVIAANFIIFGLAQSASSLLSDSGKTNLAFRKTLRDPDHKYEIYSNLLRTRIKRNLPIQIIALPIFMFKGLGFFPWLIFVIISTIILLYSVTLSLAQAEESYHIVHRIQILNLLGFIFATYFLSRIVNPSLITILIYLFTAWVPVLAYMSKAILRLLPPTETCEDDSVDKKYFSRILYANMVTLNFNPFILGMFSSNLLIIYTVSSMPLTMLMPISASLSTLVSHKFKVQSFENSKHQIMRALYFLPVAAIIVPISIPVVSFVIGFFFGADYISEPVVMVQIYSAMLSVYTGLYGNLYSVSMLSRENYRIAYSQAIIILIVGAVGVFLNLVLLVALSDFFARGVGLILAIRSAANPRNNNAYD